MADGHTRLDVLVCACVGPCVRVCARARVIKEVNEPAWASPGDREAFELAIYQKPKMLLSVMITVLHNLHRSQGKEKRGDKNKKRAPVKNREGSYDNREMPAVLAHCSAISALWQARVGCSTGKRAV